MPISGRAPHGNAPKRRSQLSSLILIDGNAIYTESDALVVDFAAMDNSQCSARRLLSLHRTPSYRWFGRTEARAGSHQEVNGVEWGDLGDPTRLIKFLGRK